MSRLLDLDDFLDPKSLTPQELYRLQSETWAQGVDYENERIVNLLESKLCWCVGQPLDIDKNDKEELMKHMNCDWQAMMIEYHVELIKGEQK
jgi:hypothetical protein